jgi:hypothetical protein
MAGAEIQESDGTWVWTSIHDFAAPDHAPACGRLYLGGLTTCGSYRLVVWDAAAGAAFGPWIRSCSTPQALASSLTGWIAPGDVLWIEQQSRSGEPMAPQFTLYLAN